jgi:predicted nuclease with TOPRIM domain
MSERLCEICGFKLGSFDASSGRTYHISKRKCINALRSENAKLREDYNRKHNQIDDLCQRVDTLNVENAKLREDRDRCAEHLNRASARLGDAQAEIERLKGEYAILKSALRA